mgnify:CR=1 FL=1
MNIAGTCRNKTPQKYMYHDLYIPSGHKMSAWDFFKSGHKSFQRRINACNSMNLTGIRPFLIISICDVYMYVLKWSIRMKHNYIMLGF